MDAVGCPVRSPSFCLPFIFQSTSTHSSSAAERPGGRRSCQDLSMREFLRHLCCHGSRLSGPLTGTGLAQVDCRVVIPRDDSSCERTNQQQITRSKAGQYFPSQRLVSHTVGRTHSAANSAYHSLPAHPSYPHPGCNRSLSVLDHHHQAALRRGVSNLCAATDCGGAVVALDVRQLAPRRTHERTNRTFSFPSITTIRHRTGSWVAGVCRRSCSAGVLGE